MDKQTGFLVAFIGADNVGKTTIVAALRAQRPNLPWVYTREPYQDARVSDPARAARERLNFSTFDRIAHYQDIIRPALAAGCVVFTDRCFACAAAYQADTPAEAESIFKSQAAAFQTPDFFFFVRCAEHTWRKRGVITPEMRKADKHYSALIIRGTIKHFLVLQGACPVEHNVNLVMSIINNRLPQPH